MRENVLYWNGADHKKCICKYVWNWKNKTSAKYYRDDIYIHLRFTLNLSGELRADIPKPPT